MWYQCYFIVTPLPWHDLRVTDSLSSRALLVRLGSEWTSSSIDYNGHMNDAAYAQVLTDANEVFLDALGSARHIGSAPAARCTPSRSR